MLASKAFGPPKGGRRRVFARGATLSYLWVFPRQGSKFWFAPCISQEPVLPWSSQTGPSLQTLRKKNLYREPIEHTMCHWYTVLRLIHFMDSCDVHLTYVYIWNSMMIHFMDSCDVHLSYVYIWNSMILRMYINRTVRCSVPWTFQRSPALHTVVHLGSNFSKEAFISRIDWAYNVLRLVAGRWVWPFVAIRNIRIPSQLWNSGRKRCFEEWEDND